jgi:hypothetical protein
MIILTDTIKSLPPSQTVAVRKLITEHASFFGLSEMKIYRDQINDELQKRELELSSKAGAITHGTQ